MLNIGTYRQLFIDDFIVEKMEYLERIFHPATKHPEPVLVADQPWEHSSFLGVIGNCVFYDEEDQTYKMYYQIYQVFPNLSEVLHAAYATSKDGLRWEKPSLGIADYKGSKENNLLFEFEGARYKKDWWAYNNVFKDTHDPNPTRRYKALGHGVLDRPIEVRAKTAQEARIGVIVAFSPDGLHWTEPAENPVLPNADTHTLLGWDDAINKYVSYPRTVQVHDYVDKLRHDPATNKYETQVRGPLRRCIGYSNSDDFIHWSETITVLAPGPDDPPDYEIYGMPVFRYEGIYLGLPWAFISAGWGPLDTQLVMSRDGMSWQKVANGSKFISLGSPGEFDDLYAISSSPVRVGNELFFYYMGCGFPHNDQYATETKRGGSIGLARLRLDGFVSLACRTDSGGTLITKPLTFSGSKLQVNCRCQKGWLRTELQDAKGVPIVGFSEQDCDPIHTDSVHHVVTWKGKSDVIGLLGKPVRLKLRLGDGELFSFGFVL